MVTHWKFLFYAVYNNSSSSTTYFCFEFRTSAVKCKSTINPPSHFFRWLQNEIGLEGSVSIAHRPWVKSTWLRSMILILGTPNTECCLSNNFLYKRQMIDIHWLHLERPYFLYQRHTWPNLIVVLATEFSVSLECNIDRIRKALKFIKMMTRESGFEKQLSVKLQVYLSRTHDILSCYGYS